MLAALALATTTIPAKVDAVAARAGLAGVVLVAKGDTVLVEQGYGTVSPSGGAKHVANERWRLASITKQIAAVRVMQAVEQGRLRLDDPLEAKLGPSLKGITARMLLQHHSGLANPDDSAAAAGEMPAFYRAAAPDFGYCTSKVGTPGADFSYNNCDYLLLGKLVGTAPLIGRYGGATIPGFVGGKPEPRFNLATFGFAGALTGTARDVYRFDRRLMTGRVLSASSLATLWTGDPKQGYQALGQWVFPAALKGCARPKRVVQRDGEIQGVQTRNFILPDDDLVVIVFTNRGSEDFQFGELWQGKGFAYDLLSAVACG